MAIPAYMWLKDEQNNPIQGNVTVETREGSAEVLSFHHKLMIPSDRDTGILTGTRKHEPCTVTKTFCSMTPFLYKACASGKTLKEMILKWYRINDNGAEEAYFEHMLQNVRVVGVEPIVSDVKSRHNEHQGHLERVSFRYETITWKYLAGNIISEDSWNKRL